jgi:hypothetical protein
MCNVNNLIRGGLAALLLWSVSAARVQADYIINVSVDTSQLTSSGLTSPFGIGFDMFSGGVASGNTATISNVQFGTGGSATGSPFTFGNASGSLSTTVSLGVDPVNNPFNYFDEGFTPGSKLTFTVDLSTNVASPPDSLSFFLIQNHAPGSLFSGGNGGNGTTPSTTIPTTHPTGADNVYFIQITANAPTVDIYTLKLSTAVPVPSSLVLSLSAVVAMGVGLLLRRFALGVGALQTRGL